MPSIQTLIFFAGALSAVALVAWAFWAGINILKADRPEDLAVERMVERRKRMIAGTRQVRFEDIRRREAERVAVVPSEADYLYEEGYSVGWPEEWTDDLMVRRN